MARRFFRRRRKPVEWVRTFVATDHVAGGVPTTNGEFMNVVFDASSDQIVAVSNILIGDDPFVTDSLVEERKEYVLQRLVGRTHIARTGYQQGGTSAFTVGGPVDFRLGLFVADCDKNGIIQGLDKWDLFESTSQDVGWMHRENYILGADRIPDQAVYSGQTSFNQAAWTFDNTNQTRAPWGLLDVHVKRRVGQLEKLYCMIAVKGIDSGYNYANNPSTVVMWADWRALISWTTTNRR